MITARLLRFCAFFGVGIASTAITVAGAQTPERDTAKGLDASLAGFTFISPGDSDGNLEEFACGIRFGFRQVISNVEGGRYAELERTGPDTAELTTFTGSQDFTVGKGVKHTVSVATFKDDNRCTVALKIRDAAPFKRGSFMNLWKQPSFTAADVLVQSTKFLYRPSFVSPYPAASVMTNFDRLAVKDCDNVGYGFSASIPQDLRDGKPIYCIKVEDTFVPIVPECMPYRDGSRCSVLMVLPAVRSGNEFDAIPAAQKYRAAIQAVIND